MYCYSYILICSVVDSGFFFFFFIFPSVVVVGFIITIKSIKLLKNLKITPFITFIYFYLYVGLLQSVRSFFLIFYLLLNWFTF